MKKVRSFKKRLVALCLAVCTFVSSIGVNECAAMNNNTQQNQAKQTSASRGTIMKGTFDLAVVAGVLYIAYKLGMLTFIFNQPKIAGNIWLYGSSIIGNIAVVNKVFGFFKKVETLSEEVEKKAKDAAETVDNITYASREVITTGAKGAAVMAKCAVPVIKYAVSGIKYAGKAAFLGVKGLCNLVDWLSD